MHLLCKQDHGGALPTDSTIRPFETASVATKRGGVSFILSEESQFHCGENEIRASLISSASVGAIPTPVTISNDLRVARP